MVSLIQYCGKGFSCLQMLLKLKEVVALTWKRKLTLLQI